jgi:hypothetical protein
MIPVLQNFGNTSIVTIGKLTIWFSYKTPIAYQVEGKPMVVGDLHYSNTTSKHLNKIEPEKKKRIDYKQFTAQLEKLTR